MEIEKSVTAIRVALLICGIITDFDLAKKEDVQIPPLLSKEHPRNKWDHEDDVKESWEDEDEPAPAPVVKPPPEKPPKKSTAKTTEKKGKTVEVVKEEKLDPLAEKLCQQRCTKLDVTEGKNCSETGIDGRGIEVEDLLGNILSCLSFSCFFPSFWEIQIPVLESYHYNGLLKAIMRPSMTGMKAADANEVSASVSAIANEDKS
ncbi:EUKARYOTIC TRANSLATION INITIATION FACTOR 3 SUBUNIT J [Salix viminalis]|uniref:EUKARYOTIC TRANSLATION INITIATION FACTOR 3 SUBUNIT J n=1 Tax=Salix viminalis TaxID=40686 RepID=A0A9Q0P9T4_SALVM|nr:EUKARYOTIC TRANSLATION INITIATION FACTOR 3 SUBUNIT J [Salix viminalis]